MNWIDALIGTVAPLTALRRVAAREAMKEVSNRYEAARLDRSLDGWWTTGADANAEIGSQLEQIRKRSRDLARNNPYVARAVDILAAKMVGQGIRPRLTGSLDTSKRRLVMDDWKWFADNADAEGIHDLYGLEQIVARTVVESGGALMRFDAAPGERIPTRVRVLEPDYIDLNQHKPLDNGGAVIHGVEFNADGQRVAYHLYNQHPGSDAFTRRRPSGDAVLRVPFDQIAHIFRGQRPEQAHGVPWCAPIVALSKHLDDLNDARIKREKIQACFAAFIRRPADIADATITAESGTQRYRQQLAPGIIERLGPDEDISFATPPAAAKDDEWQMQLLHAIAVGSGVTYSQMTGDLRQANYSSMRAGYLDFWAMLDVWQGLMLKPMMCRRLWQRFAPISQARNSIRDLPAVEWVFPTRPFIDPTKDGEAVDNALLAGRETFRDVLAARGYDPEEHIDDLRREHVELDDLNLPHIVSQPQVAETENDDGEDMVSGAQE